MQRGVVPNGTRARGARPPTADAGSSLTVLEGTRPGGSRRPGSRAAPEWACGLCCLLPRTGHSLLLLTAMAVSGGEKRHCSPGTPCHPCRRMQASPGAAKVFQRPSSVKHHATDRDPSPPPNPNTHIPSAMMPRPCLQHTLPVCLSLFYSCLPHVTVSSLKAQTEFPP